jgi:hypothetical protein
VLRDGAPPAQTVLRARDCKIIQTTQITGFRCSLRSFWIVHPEQNRAGLGSQNKIQCCTNEVDAPNFGRKIN